jgi:hypothetical protein
MSGFCLWIGEGIKEDRKNTGEEFLVYREGIRMEIRTELKNPIN